MSRMTPSYDIGRMSDRCAATGAALKAGDRYVAALYESPEGEALIRRDYTPEGWESAGERPGALFAHWRGVVPAAEKSDKPVIDAGSLMGLFEQLGEAVEPRQLAFRYVLALIMLRKRMLTSQGMREARGDVPAALLVRVRGAAAEEGPIVVIDPALDEAAIVDLTEQVRTLLRLDA
ncbi:MAG: hypothetical protein SFZ24_01920 [Planctomycetota bacterium]|nr:hypothetical protein [Planctomycetota bacterium]